MSRVEKEEVKHILRRFLEAAVPNIYVDSMRRTTWSEICGTSVMEEAQSIADDCGWQLMPVDPPLMNRFIIAREPAGPGRDGGKGELVTQLDFPYGPHLAPKRAKP